MVEGAGVVVTGPYNFTHLVRRRGVVQGAGVVVTGPHNFTHLVRRLGVIQGASVVETGPQNFMYLVRRWYGSGGRSCGNITTAFYLPCQKLVLQRGQELWKHDHSILFTLSGGGVVEWAGVVVTRPQNFLYLVRRWCGRGDRSCGNMTTAFSLPFQEGVWQRGQELW